MASTGRQTPGSVYSASGRQTPSASTFAEEDAAEQERVLGASTSDQVLERWGQFLNVCTDELKGRTAACSDHRPLVQDCVESTAAAQAAPGEAAAGADDAKAAMGLGSSALSRSICALADTLREARLCSAAAADTCFKPLALFGEVQAQAAEQAAATQTPAALLLELAELLPQLSKARALLDRAASVAEHLLRQLIGLHAAGAMASGAASRRGRSSATAEAMPSCPSLSGVEKVSLSLRPVLDMLGELLAIFVTVDGLILENPHFRRAYASYSRVIAKAALGPSGPLGAGTGVTPELNLTLEAAADLSEELREVEPFAEGNVFQLYLGRLAQSLQDLDSRASASSSALREQLAAYCRSRLQESEVAGAVAIGQLELPSQLLVPWVCLFVLTATVWKPGKADAKLVVDMWKMHKQAPVVVLQGRVAWCLGEFLQTYVPAVVADAGLRRELEDMGTIRQRQASRLDDGSFVQEMQKYRASTQIWLAGLGTACAAFGRGQVSRALKEAHATLFRGLALALRIRASLEEYLVLHIREGVPVPRSCLASVALGLCLLRSIQAGPNSKRWTELSALLQRHLALKMHTDLEDALAKKKKNADGVSKETLQVALKALYRAVGGAPPETLDWHFDVGAIALCLGGQPQFVAAGHGARWQELRLMARWEVQLVELSDTTWTYWSRELIPVLLGHVIEKPGGISSLPLLCSAFAAPFSSLLPADTPLSQAYLQELRDALVTHVLQPTVQAVEEDLRLHTHAVMQLNTDYTKEPSPEGSSHAIALLALRTLSIAPHATVDVKDEVERRLSRSFYDLGALAPQDAEAYRRMRDLAHERYGLRLLDGCLPSGRLDHGLDVIEIMRSIHLFAAQYSYSLHQQLFTQAANQGDSKVRTITVDHLATSIRRHGTGTINTIVNYTKGFLKRKLEIVVGFLANEAVRSRLLADQIWMQEQLAAKKGYSWNRALETARHIRRLGQVKGNTFLDKLRHVVTQIGNSFGYVRMVRNAGMRCAAGSLPYVDALALSSGHSLKAKQQEPKSMEDADASEEIQGAAVAEIDTTFKGAAQAAVCSPLVVDAAETADEAAHCIKRTFEASTDYLNVLAQAFSVALGTKASEAEATGAMLPTSLFYLLVPAMSLSFLDSLLVGREALTKRAVAAASTLKSNAICFDDGFAVGVACLLRIMGQEHDFHALRWFDAQVTSVGDGPAAAAAALASLPSEASAGQSAGFSRVEAFARDMGRLAATVEAASSLFGAVDPRGSGNTSEAVRAEPQEAAAEAPEETDAAV
eukprot:TRINITY_DN47360_c0_g1_i1.p1 TRINITY_DN47360_c0_g1~~TRINITY_DN47360_c0_g1_i1.p1  ORF type:complete len:1285 (+),score=290.81 TRINITY_DN47360_c0_g1_i1:32-3856(+)